MKPTDVPITTDAGNRELGQRLHKLTSRARSLLIVIHGTETVADLRRTFQTFGDVDGSLNKLAALGLIVAGAGGVALTTMQMPAANAPIFWRRRSRPSSCSTKVPSPCSVCAPSCSR